MTFPTHNILHSATCLLDFAQKQGVRIACAESLTGGMLSAALTAVPGASNVMAGSVTTYQLDTKTSVLGVDAHHLANAGPYNAQTAIQMARGVAKLFAVPAALATTGVAGPGPDGSVSAGSVWAALVWHEQVYTWEFQLAGNRAQVREATVQTLLDRALATLGA